MVKCQGGQELLEAIVANDVALVRRLFASALHDVKSSTCGCVKGLPTGEHNLTTTKELTEAVKALVKTSKESHQGVKGRFSVLIVTPSAPRAASLCGVLARSHVGSVAKLFGRHLTVDEQASFLASNETEAAVATPNRLGRLASMGALDLKRLRWVLIDTTPDEKAQTFFTTATGGERRPDGNELVELLGCEAFRTVFEQPVMRSPALVLVTLPSRSALEAATPVGQKMLARGRGRGKGGKGGGKGKGGGSRGAGRANGRPHGAIDKHNKPSAFPSHKDER